MSDVTNLDQCLRGYLWVQDTCLVLVFIVVVVVGLVEVGGGLEDKGLVVMKHMGEKL